MYCIKCGTKLGDNAKYCPHCGSEVERCENPEKVKDIVINTEKEEKRGELNPLNMEKDKMTKSEINNESPAQRILEWWKDQNKERKTIILVGVILATIILVAIFSSNSNQIVGSWSNGDGTIVFDNNGNFSMDGDMESGTYEVSGSQLKMITNRGAEYTYTFSIDNDVLTITYESGKNEVMYRNK